MKRRHVLFFILNAVIVSWVVMHFVLPEQYIYHSLSFLRQWEPEFSYYGAFTFISNLLHGGIALWDNYDQMPMTFLYAIGNVVPINALFTGFVYLLTVRLFSSPAEAFHIIYSQVYYLPCIFIASVGLYLLFRRFTQNWILLFLLIIISLTVGLPHYYLGFHAASLYAFFPIIAHFILSFFEQPSLESLLLGILTLSVVVAMDPEHTLSYFYQGEHLFLMAAFIWFIFFRLRHHKILQLGSLINKFRKSLGKIILCLITMILLVGPWIYLLRLTYHDYDFANESSRFAKIKLFDPSVYFNQFKGEETHAAQNEFLYRMIDFSNNGWEYTWFFFGSTVVFFSLAGIFLSRDSRRFVFILTAFSFWLLNSDRVSQGWVSWIHWINIYTNPFSFIVRSFHMTGAFLLSYVLLPIMSIGIAQVFNIHKEKLSVAILVRLGATVVTSIFFLLLVTPTVPANVIFSTRLSFLIFILILLFSFMRIFPYYIRIRISAILLLILVGYDLKHSREYIMKMLSRYSIQSYFIPPQSISHILDFQNPLILPLRRYIYTGPKRDGYIFEEPNNFQGLFYRYSNYSKYFTLETERRPSHISFSAFSRDLELQRYVSSVKEMMFFADTAIPDTPGMLSRILSKGLQQQVILIDRDPQKEGFFSNTLPDIPSLVPVPPILSNEYRISLVRGKKLVRPNVDIYLFPLPKNFPVNMTTGVYTEDKNLLEATIGDHTLSAEQGDLGSPWTFDVQNFSTGMLAVGLPHDAIPTGDVVLRYPRTIFPSVLDMGKYTTDSVGFNYRADHNGWLVFHYPYDSKWQVSVDNMTSSLYRVNRSFIGFPLTKGTHKIQLDYMPFPWLRIFIGLSVLLIFILPYTIVWIELTRESKKS